MPVLLALLFAALPALAADPLLFSFFRNNGEDGLYLAASTDGLLWTELNAGKPLLTPAVGEAKLMRDPSVVRAPDGVFHMVWTTAWEGKTIGHASSRDLIHWSPQQAIDVMAGVDGVANCWAPELFLDRGEFWILWASTVAGRFPETLGAASHNNNHRIYATHTRDFKSFSPPTLFYDPGFIVIDAALFRPDTERFAMVVKNETLTPPAKNLFLTYSASLEGPWTKPGPPISGPDWAEGPSPARIGPYWYIYFDKYRDHRYGAIRSRDLEHWEDVTASVHFPPGARHGTVFRAPAAIVENLRKGSR
ncbi:MAG: glycoside hydrolase family 43 protein [Bryobacteraceae bacterium]